MHRLQSRAAAAETLGSDRRRTAVIDEAEGRERA
jgi:hypothetical protein